MSAHETLSVHETTKTLRMLLDLAGQVVRLVEVPTESEDVGARLGRLQEGLRALQRDLGTISQPDASGIAPELSRMLSGVYDECSKADWDGYGALPVAESSYREALRLGAAIPSSFPLPEVSADPDGEISFEWRDGPGNAFSVSVSSAGDLSYAGVFGNSRVHGVEQFGADLPDAIRYGLSRVPQHEGEEA